MWNAIIEGISPHLLAGGIMVAVMGVMFVAHKIYGSKHKPEPRVRLKSSSCATPAARLAAKNLKNGARLSSGNRVRWPY